MKECTFIHQQQQNNTRNTHTKRRKCNEHQAAVTKSNGGCARACSVGQQHRDRSVEGKTIINSCTFGKERASFSRLVVGRGHSRRSVVVSWKSTAATGLRRQSMIDDDDNADNTRRDEKHRIEETTRMRMRSAGKRKGERVEKKERRHCSVPTNFLVRDLPLWRTNACRDISEGAGDGNDLTVNPYKIL